MYDELPAELKQRHSSSHTPSTPTVAHTSSTMTSSSLLGARVIGRTSSVVKLPFDGRRNSQKLEPLPQDVFIGEAQVEGYSLGMSPDARIFWRHDVTGYVTFTHPTMADAARAAREAAGAASAVRVTNDGPGAVFRGAARLAAAAAAAGARGAATRWITREEYDEYGPALAHRKSLDC